MEVKTSEKEEIHVLMVAFAAQGHLNPMIGLGKRLVSNGLHVTLATTDNIRDRLFSSAADEFIDGIQFKFFSDEFNHDEYTGSAADVDRYMDCLDNVGPTNLSIIIQNHSPKFSCIINNPFVPWTVDVAAEYGIPCTMLWIQPCSVYAIYYHYFSKLIPFPSSSKSGISVELPGLPLLQAEDLPSFVLPSINFVSFPKILLRVFQNLEKVKWVLVNSFYELEKNVIGSMNDGHKIRPVGPLVPSSLLGKGEEELGVNMWKIEDNCIEWLDKQQPCSVVYVSFGSLVRLPAEEMESIATALKQSNRPFLWVVKPPPPEIAGREGRWNKLPLGFSDETKDQGLVVRWSPQTKVLAHPSVGCFLSHCGWNSLLETITAGVPIIAYPNWSDQPTNAKLVTDVFRVGVRLRPDDVGVVGSEEVGKCIEEIMGGPRSEEYKKNAEELKRPARAAVADGGSSDNNIQLFVNDIIAG